MGFDEPELYDADEELLAYALGGDAAILGEITVQSLRRDGVSRVNAPEDFRPYAHGDFATSSGRAELSSQSMQRAGNGLVGTYVPAVEGPHSSVAERFPLCLMTPKVHTRFLNSSYAHMPNHGGREGGPYVELSAADAAARSLRDGDFAVVFNDRGELRLPVRVGTAVRSGVIAVPFGWNSASHADGRTANSLTSDRPADWGGGVAFWDTMVEVRRAQ
jgi:anaerobic selenocysteine-containing dehydrogenase